MATKLILTGSIIINRISSMDLRVLRALFKSLKMRLIDTHIFIYDLMHRVDPMMFLVNKKVLYELIVLTVLIGQTLFKVSLHEM